MEIDRREAFGHDNNKKDSALVKMALLVMFVAAAIYLVRFSPARQYLSAQQLGLFLNSVGIWAPVMFVIVYVAGGTCSTQETVGIQNPAMGHQSHHGRFKPVGRGFGISSLPTGLALLASAQNWGLLNQFVIPSGLKGVLGFLLLDLTVYTQHVLHHALPALWRLHMVHHADLDFDVTTGLRFHPLEIVISMAVKLAAMAALGASPVAVLIFEVVVIRSGQRCWQRSSCLFWD